MLRTHDAGTLRKEHVGQEITLAGWVARRRDHGGVAFIDLRDASGMCQIVVRDEYLQSQGINDLRHEFCIQVKGVVDARDADNINPNIPTGEVEVAIRELTILNAAAPLPFQIDEHSGVGEDARLRFRYLDLRRPAQHNALVLRSQVTSTIRHTLDRHNFYDIETPTMTRSTPEGARDFIVPARLHPGSWYALPQSPQLFKQLLMVAGMERYYQIARCYRDEDFRADRQPEFTQVDVEMSFCDQEDILALAETVMGEVWKLIDVEIPKPMPRMSWHDAM
ncbi:MAG: aspartate--tRNA ligase, partial [Propionibacteriaceae bacterium]